MISPRGRTYCLVAVLALGLTLPAATPAAGPDPQQAQDLIDRVTSRMLEVVRDQAEHGEIDIQVVRRRIDELVVPRLDFVTMTKLAVGRHWLDATVEQKRALVEAFRELFVRTYTEMLKQYDDQELEMLPLQPGPREDRVTVRSRVIQKGGSKIQIDYGLHYDDGEWRVYDIVVDGVSLVTTRRATFVSEIREAGIDGLIEELQRKNERNATLEPRS